MKNILVAINFEKNAEHLISKAEEMAVAFNSKIWILHVTEPDPDDYLGLEAGPQFAQDRRVAKRKKEQALVEDLTQKLKDKGFDAEGLLISGPTAKTIKKEVKRLDIDMVIAGHHKRNFFYQMFVGNVEQDIIEDLKVPVLLIPLN
ncbi:Nucleotide-binding universal stress protein, UspA family [Salinimicrobium catena]|uniref:Universal stress protein n=1 Tax=Salinimicrobium catena TaxID=390640 RepID=A0A1H5NEI8_9FLAO|nr:universal stress protein [Salinimicrobium catena]SDL44415.1 Nucleotide-binding universal stress protein, UspA family [Salinimicrobium catena]SEF00013.1 Nucleotide-binding universal stress protein, UspA family [Salinimicrobium catena]